MSFFWWAPGQAVLRVRGDLIHTMPWYASGTSSLTEPTTNRKRPKPVVMALGWH